MQPLNVHVVIIDIQELSDLCSCTGGSGGPWRVLEANDWLQGRGVGQERFERALPDCSGGRLRRPVRADGSVGQHVAGARL